MACYTECKNMYREAYDKVCHPLFAAESQRANLNTSLRWLTAQSDTVLSIYDAFVEIDQAGYNLSHEKFISDPWQSLLVKRDMNRVLENLATALEDELKFTLDTRFDTDTEQWTELTLLQTVKLIVAQGSSRFTVGLPLCKVPTATYLGKC
jgi:hypothetical protein